MSLNQDTVWLVYKNGLYWGSQAVIAVCATEALALEYAKKNEELQPKDRHLYGYHCVAMKLLQEESQVEEQKPLDLRTLSKKNPELLF